MDRAVTAGDVFSDLDPQQLRGLLMRIRLYAEWKVRARAHRSPELDPEDLALRAIEQTLSGERQWNRARFALLKHLTNCIDSYVSHHYASARRRHLELVRSDADALEQVASRERDPEAETGLDREVAALERYVREHHPRLEPLLALVVEHGVSLSDRAEVARRLGLDPSDSAQMQRAYRAINALKQAVMGWQREARG